MTGLPVRMSASTATELRRQLAAASGLTTRSSADTGPSPAADREREQLGDGGELGQDPPLPLGDLGGEPVLAQQHAEQRRRPRRARAAARCGPGERSATSTETAAATPKPTSPHSTCSTRKSCTVIGRLARSSRRRIDALPPSTRSRESAAEPSTGPNTARNAPVRAGRRRAAVASLREVADVGQHPHGELRSAQLDDPADRPARGRRRPGRRAARPTWQGHDSTRRSVGQPADPHHQRGRPRSTARRRRPAPPPRPARRSARSPRAGSTAAAAPATGAATASRAPLTVQACRDSSSERVRASSRRKPDRLRSRLPSSPPPTSRAMRSPSTTRSPTGSASRTLSRSRLSAKRPVTW